jgi:hypothetical protein
LDDGTTSRREAIRSEGESRFRRVIELEGRADISNFSSWSGPLLTIPISDRVWRDFQGNTVKISAEKAQWISVKQRREGEEGSKMLLVRLSAAVVLQRVRKERLFLKTGSLSKRSRSRAESGCGPE